MAKRLNPPQVAVVSRSLAAKIDAMQAEIKDLKAQLAAALPTGGGVGGPHAPIPMVECPAHLLDEVRNVIGLHVNGGQIIACIGMHITTTAYGYVITGRDPAKLAASEEQRRKWCEDAGTTFTPLRHATPVPLPPIPYTAASGTEPT